MLHQEQLSRRDALKLAAAGVIGYSMSGWLEVAAQQAAANPQRRRSCILLWMNGGPSQMDTFDLKPGHANGGPYRAIQTNVPGIRISEHLPRVARHMDKLSLVRAMSTREGDHGRGTFYLRSGYLPQGPIQYPTLGSMVAKEIGAVDLPLPSFVSIAPYRVFSPASFSSGFLGPQYAPLMVGEVNQFNFNPGQGNQYDDASLRVADLRLSTGRRSDAHHGSHRVRSVGRTVGGSRQLWPQHVRPGLLACSPPGGTQCAVR
jgi:hypothetical protein